MKDQLDEVKKLLEGQRHTRTYFERMGWGESAEKMTPGVEALEWAVAQLESTDYEYAIQYHDEIQNAWKITGQYFGNVMEPAYWGELEEREAVIDDFRLDYPHLTFLMVKRRKAGKMWYA